MKPEIVEALSAGGASALENFGTRPQMIKACEEMGELITVLCKKLNGSPVTDEAIIDEVADVLTMSHQMYAIFDKAAIDKRIVYKLDRLLSAIRKRNGGVQLKLDLGETVRPSPPPFRSSKASYFDMVDAKRNEAFGDNL